MTSIKSGAMFTNSGMFTPRFAAVAFSTRIAGLSLPFSSMWVRNNCVNSERPFDENASHARSAKRVQEFIGERLQFIRRAVPPSNGTMYSSLSGRMSRPFLFLDEHDPLCRRAKLWGNCCSSRYRAAPSTGSGLPPLPSLNGIRYRSY